MFLFVSLRIVNTLSNMLSKDNSFFFMSKVHKIRVDDPSLDPFLSVIEDRHDYISVTPWIPTDR